MKRRHFIHAAMASVMFPAASRGHIAAPKKPHYVFFDERFRAARRAVALSGQTQLVAVQGDVTSLWRDELERMTRDHPVRLRGATTYSFLFCLKILVGERADLDLQVSRLDRDLYRWTMSTAPKAE